MLSFSRLQHISLQIAILAIILANYFLLHNAIVGSLVAIVYLLLNSKKISDVFFNDIHQGLRKTLSFVVILTYIAVVYTISYHLFSINMYTWLWTLISIPLAVEWFSWRSNSPHYFLTSYKHLSLSYQKILNT